jgi:hypothetical protein
MARKKKGPLSQDEYVRVRVRVRVGASLAGRVRRSTTKREDTHSGRVICVICVHVFVVYSAYQ